MFGYIKPEVPDLRVRDNELYKAYYCGLCRAMGAHICRGSRFTLSYDVVFLAIVRAAAANEAISVKRKRCMAHPLKKRAYVECTPSLEYSAKASALLTYYKVEDDVADSKGIKKQFKKFLRPAVRRYRKKAALPELDEMIKRSLERLSSLEKSGGGAEECADCFGAALGDIFAYAFGDKATERILSDFGYHVGRWVYFIDAADDYEKDKESGEFNPFSAYDPFPAEEIRYSALLELDAAKKSLDLISFENKRLFDIIENIIYLGMPEAADRVLGKTREQNEEGDK